MIQNGVYYYLKEYFPEELPSYQKRKIPQNYIVDEFADVCEEAYTEYICRKDTMFKSYIDHYIDQIMAQQSFPLFNKIEIETYNRCNNDCSFCPVSRGHDRRPSHFMESALFYDIIGQLSQLKYRGVISLYSNNEPLLDDRMTEFLQHARRSLPEAFFLFYTNGILLTQEKFPVLLQNTDLLYINCYTKDRRLPDRTYQLQQYLIEKKVPVDKVEIHLRNKTECLSTRAGNSPNRTTPACLKSKCILPFSQIVVRSEGKVSLCCNDAYGEYTLGDVREMSLLEIWNGNPFRNLRDQALQGRFSHPACRKCDMLYMPLAYETSEKRSNTHG